MRARASPQWRAHGGGGASRWPCTTPWPGHGRRLCAFPSQRQGLASGRSQVGLHMASKSTWQRIRIEGLRVQAQGRVAPSLGACTADMLWQPICMLIGLCFGLVGIAASAKSRVCQSASRKMMYPGRNATSFYNRVTRQTRLVPCSPAVELLSPGCGASAHNLARADWSGTGTPLWPHQIFPTAGAQYFDKGD